MDRRKELKQAYKQTPRPMGVYRIKNNLNGKILVGSSMNLEGIFNRYTFQGGTKSLFNKALQQDWTELGAGVFTFEILETLKWEELPEEQWKKAVEALEEKWLDQLKPYGEKGYNIERSPHN